ncbi:MAG: triose-phosphate isomerase [Patescibacteria group bacterium]
MKKLIVANWKMNPASLKEAKGIFNEIKKVASKLKNVETVICPPFVYLSAISYQLSAIKLGAQDVFWENPATGGGAYTGEISLKMLKNFGARYVIIGHSERRENLQETDEMVNKKVKSALKGGFRVIFCIGEKKRDDESYLYFIRDEILNDLKDINRKLLKNLIIAYEPIWAIGKTGKAADSPENVFQMGIFIRKTIMHVAGEKLSRNIPILYGGSVDSKNCAGFFKEGNMQGLLIGGKSLIPKEFNKILKIANKA